MLVYCFIVCHLFPDVSCVFSVIYDGIVVVSSDIFYGSSFVKLSALNQLRNIFGLGKREAETIVLDITSKVYRKRLAQAVTGGDLEMADSKAAFLQNICEELHFDPQKASEIHEGSYVVIPVVCMFMSKLASSFLTSSNFLYGI